MQTIKWLILALVMGVTLNACTITKRHYNNGYHIEWRSHNVANKEQSDQVEHDFSVSSEVIQSAGAIEDVQQTNKEQSNAHPTINHSIKEKLLENRLPRFHSFEKENKGLKLKDGVTSLKKGTEFLNKKKSQNNIGEVGLRTPREYLIAALACLIGAIVLIGIAVLFIVVIEIEGLSIGGLFVFLMLIVGVGCLFAVPISLLLALFSYLYYL
jgi:preprotein translocase subunit SecF